MRIALKAALAAVAIVPLVALAVVLAGHAGHKPPEVHAGPQPLVAKQLIPKGTLGSIVVKNGMYAASTIPPGEAEEDALVDPQPLVGRTATVDILPGQQLTLSDFSGATSN